jgi:hypothetical protein
MNAHDEIGWEEVKDAAANIFNVWYNGCELSWAKEAWRHFGKAGLNQASSALDRTRVNLRLVALGRIYHEFCGCAWDENPDTPIGYLVEILEIDPIALGIIAASAGTEHFDIIDERELKESALIIATDLMCKEIFNCLKAAYGDEIKLYSRMWKTSRVADDDDEEDDHVDEEFEVTGHNMRALNYVMQGFHG